VKGALAQFVDFQLLTGRSRISTPCQSRIQNRTTGTDEVGLKQTACGEPQSPCSNGATARTTGGRITSRLGFTPIIRGKREKFCNEHDTFLFLSSQLWFGRLHNMKNPLRPHPENFMAVPSENQLCTDKSLCFKFCIIIAILSFSLIATAKSTEEIYNDSKESIVLILCYDGGGNLVSQGSGFFVNDNQIATNFHVVDGASKLMYKSIQGNRVEKVNKVLSFSKSLDLAILSATSDRKPLYISKHLFDRVGAKVIAIGNPKGLTGSVSEGIISGVRRLGSFTFLQTTAPISPGSSGGPLFNEMGEVVGVTSLVLAGGNSQNLNFAIPSYLLRNLAQRGGNWEPVKRPGPPPPTTGDSVAARESSRKHESSGNIRFGLPWAGVFINRYPNGQKKKELRYRDGKMDGTCTFWYSNGVKSKQSQWKNGKHEGLWITWDESGRVTDRVVYRNGVESR
jgi:hypothetical protein